MIDLRPCHPSEVGHHAGRDADGPPAPLMKRDQGGIGHFGEPSTTSTNPNSTSVRASSPAGSTFKTSVVGRYQSEARTPKASARSLPPRNATERTRRCAPGEIPWPVAG